MWTINDVKEEAPKEPLSRAPQGDFLILLLEMGWLLATVIDIIGFGFLGASPVTSLKVHTVCNNESRYQYRLTSYFTVLPSATSDKLLLPNLLNIDLSYCCRVLFLTAFMIFILAPKNN